MTIIDSQGIFVRDARIHSGGELTSTSDGAPASESRNESPVSRAMRVSMARAFPVRTARLREALVSGSITKLTRP